MEDAENKPSEDKPNPENPETKPEDGEPNAEEGGDESQKEEEEDVNDMAKLPEWDRQVDEMCTAADTIKEVEKDYEEVLEFFQGDPAKDMFKQHYETFHGVLKKLLQNEKNLAKK